MHRATGFIAHRLPAAVQRVCSHHRSPAATVRIVIHLILLVGGVIPNLMGIDFDKATFLRPPQDTFA